MRGVKGDQLSFSAIWKFQDLHLIPSQKLAKAMTIVVAVKPKIHIVLWKNVRQNAVSFSYFTVGKNVA